MMMNQMRNFFMALFVSSKAIDLVDWEKTKKPENVSC